MVCFVSLSSDVTHRVSSGIPKEDYSPISLCQLPVDVNYHDDGDVWGGGHVASGDDDDDDDNDDNSGVLQPSVCGHCATWASISPLPALTQDNPYAKQARRQEKRCFLDRNARKPSVRSWPTPLLVPSCRRLAKYSRLILP